MGIRNPLEQNLLETKEQKEDVISMVNGLYGQSNYQRFLNKEALQNHHHQIFHALHAKTRSIKKLSQIIGFIVLLP